MLRVAGLAAGLAVDRLPDDVGVAGVPLRLGDHVHQDLVERDLAAGRPTTAPGPAASRSSSAKVTAACAQAVR